MNKTKLDIVAKYKDFKIEVVDQDKVSNVKSNLAETDDGYMIDFRDTHIIKYQMIVLNGYWIILFNEKNYKVYYVKDCEFNLLEHIENEGIWDNGYGSLIENLNKYGTLGRMIGNEKDTKIIIDTEVNYKHTISLSVGDYVIISVGHWMPELWYVTNNICFIHNNKVYKMRFKKGNMQDSDSMSIIAVCDNTEWRILRCSRIEDNFSIDTVYKSKKIRHTGDTVEGGSQ